MDAAKVIDAGNAGRISGLLVGLFQGAGWGSVVIPVPVVGSFCGAVVGGVVGAKVGRYLGREVGNGATAVTRGLTGFASALRTASAAATPALRGPPARQVELAPSDATRRALALV